MRLTSLIFVLILFNGLHAQSGTSQVHDVPISNGECSVHYLTHQNTIGWRLADLNGLCNQGLIDGDASVKIQNAFGKTLVALNGHFNQGYYTEKLLEQVPLKSLYLDQNFQTLSFLVPTDQNLGVEYVGYMIAEKLADGDYGPFLACQPVRLMAITPNIELFEDESFQQKIINSAISRAQTFCANPSRIFLYGSEHEKPENGTISFFADINLDSRQIKVKRLPPSNRIRDIWRNPEDSSPIPKEIRHESGEKILQITPQIPSETPIIDKQNKNAKKRTEEEHTTLLSKNEEKQENNPKLDAIPHLLAAARILRQPIPGKVRIHISDFDDEGIALIDIPLPMKAKGSGLSLGWGIAEGNFTYIGGSSTTPNGFIQIRTFTPEVEKIP